MRAKLAQILIGGAVLLGAAIAAWMLAEHRAQQQMAALQQQLRETAAEAARYRQLLRQQTLEQTVRTPDGLLALFPARFPTGDWRPAEVAFEDCWFESEDGLRLHGWFLPHPAPQAIVLSLHGNAGNLSHRAALAQEIHNRAAASVFLFDYRGYGRSEGAPTFAGLLRDARAARRSLAQRLSLPERQIVLLGESLGGAIAVELASSDGARGLVLDSTFSSLQDAAGTHFPPLLARLAVADKINSAAAIASFHGPLLQFHGDQDSVVPYALGQKLFTAAHEPKTFVTLTQLDHNDPRPAQFFKALAAFLKSLPP